MRSPPTGQNSDIGTSKGGIAKSIENRVDSGVDVAKVVGKLPHDLRDELVGRLLAQDGVEDDENAVGSPRDDEGH